MQNRRTQRTPFTANGVVISDALGGQVAIVSTPELAAFICKCANNYDDLVKAVIGCKGEILSNVTQPITRPLLRDLLALISRLEGE